MSLLGSWTLLRRYLRPHAPRVLLLAVVLGAGLGLQLVAPQFLRACIDAALAGPGAPDPTAAAARYLGAALAAYLAALVATAVAEDLGWAATVALRADLVAHCLRLDLAFHHAQTPGALVERADGDVRALAHLFSRLVLQVLGNLLLLGGVLIALWRTDARLGAAFAAFALVALLALAGLRHTGVAAWDAARAARANLLGFAEERLAGAVDLRANGAVGATLAHLAVAQRALGAAEARAWRAAAPPRDALGLLFVVGTALALGLGGALVRRGDLSVGTLALVYAYATTLFAPLARLGGEVAQLQVAAAVVPRVLALLETAPAIPDGAVELPAGPLGVVFAGVTFGYDPAEPVLRDIAFALAPGQTLGVLGRTGGGKTTLTRLLLRLHAPQAGTIRLGGVALDTVREAALRARVGVATQEVRLFAATVRDNLTLFADDVPDARLLAALDDVGLGAWCRALPAGLDTALPPGGGGLSAGEAQLLALARLGLDDPGLVILDEATARLDPATAARLEAATARLLAGRTAIVIAHRLAAVRRADAILILAGGRVVEAGPRAALAADPTSVFARLLRADAGEVPS